jgi:membrane-bound metal-dependent hydrolase YbcI (DUF457 family)
MPSPLAHFGTGYAVYRLYEHRLPPERRWLWFVPFQALLIGGVSLLPDLDVILAFVNQDMQTYHNHFTHSLFFGLFAAGICAGFLYWFYRASFRFWFGISYLSYTFHILMDFFTGERGVMFFWPFSLERFASPVKLFLGVQWGLGWFTVWHIWTLLSEAFFVILLFWIVNRIVKRRNGGTNSPGNKVSI